VSTFPADLQYTADHEWLAAGDPVTFGITDTATAALGDIVFLELPDVGAQLIAGAPCGEIESTKSVSELFSPVAGTVVEINQAAVDDPALVNSAPYGAGWLVKATATGNATLLTAAEYRTQVAG